MTMNNMMKNFNLTRPNDKKRTNIPDGNYKGRIVEAEIKEISCNYSPTGKRIVLNIKARIDDGNGNTEILYKSVNYVWHEQGNMVKLLDDLGELPKPGQELVLENLIDIPVNITIENVEKDGAVYSNIVRITRDRD